MVVCGRILWQFVLTVKQSWTLLWLHYTKSQTSSPEPQFSISNLLQLNTTIRANLLNWLQLARRPSYCLEVPRAETRREPARECAHARFAWQSAAPSLELGNWNDDCVIVKEYG